MTDECVRVYIRLQAPAVRVDGSVDVVSVLLLGRAQFQSRIEWYLSEHVEHHVEAEMWASASEAPLRPAPGVGTIRARGRGSRRF